MGKNSKLVKLNFTTDNELKLLNRIHEVTEEKTATKACMQILDLYFNQLEMLEEALKRIESLNHESDLLNIIVYHHEKLIGTVQRASDVISPDYEVYRVKNNEPHPGVVNLNLFTSGYPDSPRDMGERAVTLRPGQKIPLTDLLRHSSDQESLMPAFLRFKIADFEDVKTIHVVHGQTPIPLRSVQSQITIDSIIDVPVSSWDCHIDNNSMNSCQVKLFCIDKTP